MAQHMVYCVNSVKEAPGIDEDDIQGEVALEMVESIADPSCANVSTKMFHGSLGTLEGLPDHDHERISSQHHGP